MPTNISLKFNTKRLEQSIDRLQQNAPAAFARALNRAIGSANTVMTREVSNDTGLKVSDVRDRIGTHLADPTHLVAQLTASVTPVPLFAYGARGPEPSRGKGHGVTSRLKGGAQRYPRAFIATMKSGHKGVFERLNAAQAGASRRLGAEFRGMKRKSALDRFQAAVAGAKTAGRLPIYELHGPSIARVFTKHVQVGLARGREQLVKNLQSELQYAMRKTA
jgi:hypothetical protein